MTLQPTSQRGFTLLEILVALAVFSMIGLASTALLTSVIDDDAASTARFAELEKLQRAMLTIERDVLQAVPRASRVAGEQKEIVMQGGEDELGGQADSLALVRAGWLNPQLMLPRSTLQAVGYRLNEGKLERLYGNYVDNVIGFEPKSKVLLENVNDFQVEFLVPQADGNDNSDQQQNWQESYKGTVLPKAVAISIDTQVFGLIRREFVLVGG